MHVSGSQAQTGFAKALNDQSNQGTVNLARGLVLQQGESFLSVVFDIMQSS
jgi:hypothetical protein